MNVIRVGVLCAVFNSIKNPLAASMSTAANRDIYVPPDLSQLTSDAKKWYLQGVANAEKNLDGFGKIAEKIKAGQPFKDEYVVQLRELLGPVEEANENTKVLVPRLEGLIDNLYSWSKPPISFFSKVKLKGIIWFIQGKRDNKSYYLQNGGGLWCKLRIEKYLDPISDNPTAKTLISDLNGLKEDILYARDALDDAAQVYVQGINKLDELTCDVGKNEKEIWEVVQKLHDASKKASPEVLKSAQDAVDVITKKINSL